MAFNAFERLQVARQCVQQNRLAVAEAEVASVLRHEPAHAPARTLLAIIYLRSGRIQESDAILSSLVLEHPNLIDAIGLLAFIRKSQNRLPEAIEFLQKLPELGQDTADIHNQIGTCWLEIGDAVAAGREFKRAIELDRTAPHSYYNLGLALKLAGRSYETYMTFKRAAELDPNFHDTYVQLWQQMRQLLNWTDGLPVLENGLRIHPTSTKMKMMVASTYGKVGWPEKAEQIYKEAAASDPTAGPHYAHWLQEEGRFDESVPVLQAAIRHQPIQGQAYYNLAIAKCSEFDGTPLVDLILPLLENEHIGEEGRMFLFYALAKIYEQEKKFELAMRNYDCANDIAYKLYNSIYDHDAFAADTEHAALLRLYSTESVAKLRKHGSASTVPIMIVGMIRTGTTLLDHILSSHPNIRSAGEQPFWQVSAGRVNRRWLESGGDPADIKDLAERYLEALREATGDAPKITDKMPTNFIHMGLISVVFPKAKFIHIRRNPVDTCLSIYTTFLGSGTQFAYSKANIVAYYQEYLRTMEHWRSVIPADQMIEIDYEDLVSNKEAVLREVLKFCGIEWDNSVLEHERNTSQISTPSLWTARQPVNTASVERWRKVEPWLGKLLELKDVRHPAPTYSRS